MLVFAPFRDRLRGGGNRKTYERMVNSIVDGNGLLCSWSEQELMVGRCPRSQGLRALGG